jgi:phage baseplate assembly protein W
MPELSTTYSVPRQYKDLSLTMARNPVTNDVVAVTGAEAVKRSLRFLLLSDAGETPFFPEFGTRLRRLLFEPIDPITTVLLQREIEATIKAYEPRVNIQQLTVTASEDEHSYYVNLLFSLVNQTTPVTFTIYLSRLR